MTKIKSFQAIVYNQEKIKDLTSVVCPPYDIISPNRQEYYHHLSPYNLTHILLGKDIPGEDKYQRARNYFREWLKNKILIQEDKPCIYFYRQQYKIKGESKTRFGLIALLHLEDKKPSVFGHEHTRLEPKEDRLRLLRQVKANLSPIFVVFSDKQRVIQHCDQEIENKKPFIEVTDDEKTTHRLWRLDRRELINKIQSGIEKENIFIADGHHRYEVACAYRDEMKEKSGSIKQDEDFDYILAYFTNIESRGLTILPIHRLVKLEPGFDPDTFRSQLKDYFSLEEIRDKIRFFFLLEKAGNTEHVLGMCQGARFWLLRLKNIKILDKIMSDKPLEYRTLDVSILNSIVFRKILGLDLEDKEKLIFSANAEEFIARANDGNSYVVLLLNPVKIQQIISVALAGEKMPAKSTYFYPKVLSGLVINKLEDV